MALRRVGFAILTLVAVGACDGGRRGSTNVIRRVGDMNDGAIVDGRSEERNDAGVGPDAGGIDCSNNPFRCAPHELAAADCRCLGICQAGWTFNRETSLCDPLPGSDAGEDPDAEPFRDSGARDDSGAPPNDAGTPPPDAGVPGFDASVWPDATVWPDAAVTPDAGTPPADAGFVDAGMPGPGALGSACTVNANCNSTVCFDFGSSTGGRCVSACSRSQDCPVGFTCYDNNGAKMCTSASLFTGATFTQPNGASCTTGGSCRSNFCRTTPAPNMCVETCSDDSDCSGASCAWRMISQDIYQAACDGPVGAGLPGSACTTNTTCRSGACVNSTCASLCSSTSQCANGQVCSQVDYSVCTLDIGICLQYEPNFVTTCVASQHGTSPIGAPCTDFGPCRSGLCHTTISECTDVCGTDADCPTSYRCKTLGYGTLADSTPIYINVCAPLGF